MNQDNTKVQARLRLADHVRACVIEDKVVLLDLSRDRYLGLSGAHARIVAEAIVDPISPVDATTPIRQASEHGDLAAQLVGAHILTSGPGAAPPRQRRIPLPVASMEVHGDASALPIRFLDLYRFLLAIALAAFWLRYRTLRSIAQSMDARLLRCECTGANRASRLRRAVAVFDRLRPLTFTSRDKCLFDSLALMTFLARQGLSAHWVIGVSIQPFRAHSWVQDGHEVLNDFHDNVQRFTPILVV